MPRRTKIVATLGPATDAPGVLEAMIKAGLDVARINFSHGNPEQHRTRVATLRETAARLGRTVGVLVDLQGPKIRIDRFREGAVTLRDGAPFVLDAKLAPDAGTEGRVGITYKSLVDDVRAGDVLLLDDGAITLQVESVGAGEIRCRVENGGELSNNKGINRQGGGLSAGALTDKDRADIGHAIAIGADYMALSFVRDAADVREARALIEAGGGQAELIAKIERVEALADIESIIDAADGIMVARGDLAVEIGDAEVPGVQKRLIYCARERDRVVITATQMMQSMVDAPVPTRAEVSDVANAVLDGTDAVMLSAETATGRYPVKAIQAMDRVCRGAESQRETRISRHRMERTFSRSDEAIAMAAMYTANHLNVKAIAALTESGSTPLWMSRISSGIPIYALTRRPETLGRVTLYRGVYPLRFPSDSKEHAVVNAVAVKVLREHEAVQDGDLIIITKGDLMGQHGGTNAMKILRVGDEFIPMTD